MIQSIVAMLWDLLKKLLNYRVQRASKLNSPISKMIEAFMLQTLLNLALCTFSTGCSFLLKEWSFATVKLHFEDIGFKLFIKKQDSEGTTDNPPFLRMRFRQKNVLQEGDLRIPT